MASFRFLPFWVWLAAASALPIFSFPSFRGNDHPLWPSQTELDHSTVFQFDGPVVCLGPRGKLLNESSGEQIRPQGLPNRK